MDIFSEVRKFYQSYRGEKRMIGRSALGREIFALRTGRGTPCGIAQYAIHAREWICALLALEHVRRPLPKGSAWIVPLSNPDGALLCTEGLESVPKEKRAFLRRLNGGEDFSLWKANAEGVDLNVNFDAKWGTGASNVFTPAPENYVGEHPFSAPETRAIRDFTLLVRPDYTVSWHTKGEVIYWRFHQPPLRALRDRALAKRLSEATGYPLGEAGQSAGGYKDWCIDTLKIPAFTVEAGRESLPHPLGRDALPDILRKNTDALARLSEGFK